MLLIVRLRYSAIDQFVGWRNCSKEFSEKQSSERQHYEGLSSTRRFGFWESEWGAGLRCRLFPIASSFQLT